MHERSRGGLSPGLRSAILMREGGRTTLSLRRIAGRLVAAAFAAWFAGLSAAAGTQAGGMSASIVFNVPRRDCARNDAEQAISAPARGSASVGMAIGTTGCDAEDDDGLTSKDPSGTVTTVSASGALDRSNPFFLSLGTNGRTCATCHEPAAAWTITPAGVRARFEATLGEDPIFRPNDGANSPRADTSTVQARRQAYSMLLNKGVIRVGLPVPPGAEFSLADVDDPYGFASPGELSLFRRPLPATNLRFLTGVMWDDRETQLPFTPPMAAGAAMNNLIASLGTQAINATLGHAQAAAAPGTDKVARIVAFELGLTTAQARSRGAGRLDADNAIGGPRVLAEQPFHIGSNDALGADPVAQPDGQAAMHLFEAWQADNRARPVRNAIARGEQIFNSRAIAISGVNGLNDSAQLPLIAGTCATCHDTPNVGNHSVSVSMNIGTSDADRRTSDMPLYTFANAATGARLQTTDPGRALVTGKWADIGKFKNPVLRGLAARAPYFHNGMAATLADVVDFYEQRFGIGLTAQERDDLVAFLAAL